MSRYSFATASSYTTTRKWQFSREERPTVAVTHSAKRGQEPKPQVIAANYLHVVWDQQGVAVEVHVAGAVQINGQDGPEYTGYTWWLGDKATPEFPAELSRWWSLPEPIGTEQGALFEATS